jgi:hypothetical protein
MDLASARSLKAELAHEVMPRMLALHAERRAVRAFGLRRLTGVEPGVAFGIGAGAGPGDYRLAVRLQRRAFERDEVLRRRILEVAGQEGVDISYIGSVFKCTRRMGVTPLKTAPERPWYQQRQRPLRIGVSVGHAAVTAGTLGAFGQRSSDGKTVILSNNHVLANENKGKPGDAVLQPGAYDGGQRDADVVARLLAFVPIRAGANNLVDAAIATLEPQIEWDASALTGFGRLDGLRPESLVPGDPVFKIGRTTGLTRGVVTAIEVDDVVVSYERGEIGFDRQIEIASAEKTRPFSSGGDSGSMIFDADGRACALLFAGSDMGGPSGLGVTYANELGLALQALDTTLLTRLPGA